MCHTNNKYFSGATLPRLAMINSFAGFGRCSTTISLPVISTMHVQVCPVPTSILSNHLAFPICHRVDYSPYVRDYINTWKELNVTFDGLYCGFLGTTELCHVVQQFIKDFQPPVFLLDPVMGDNGRKYTSVTDAHCEALRQLANHATLLTPNLFEACLLTGVNYETAEIAFGKNIDVDVQNELFQKLQALCPGDIVISGVEQGEYLVNYVLQCDHISTVSTKKAGGPHHGTGDLFASILVADALNGADLISSVKKAADFVSLCIHGTEEAGAPEIEGVLFEKYLSKLIH